MTPAIDIGPSAAPSPPITLYTYAMSPYAWKVHASLLYKGLSFECFYVNPLKRLTHLPVGRQVPVLKIGDESRADSTPICLWLDQLYPDQALLVPTDPLKRKRILEIDDWISNRLIPATFRTIPGEGLNVDRVLNGWRLSHIMNKTAHGGMPWLVRALWPLILSQLSFLRHAVATTDRHLSLPQANDVLYSELIDHLGDGPFLGESETPTLADLAAFPQLVMPARAGMRSTGAFTKFPRLLAWTERVESQLTPSPPILPTVVTAPRAKSQSVLDQTRTRAARG